MIQNEKLLYLDKLIISELERQLLVKKESVRVKEREREREIVILRLSLFEEFHCGICVLD